MDFSLLCDYYSYVMGARFPVCFSCACLRPQHLEAMRALTPAEGRSLWQTRALYALRYGDCRLSYRGSGAVVFLGHEFSAAPEGEGVRIRFDDECTFLLTEQDCILYL